MLPNSQRTLEPRTQRNWPHPAERAIWVTASVYLAEGLGPTNSDDLGKDLDLIHVTWFAVRERNSCRSGEPERPQSLGDVRHPKVLRHRQLLVSARQVSRTASLIAGPGEPDRSCILT